MKKVTHYLTIVAILISGMIIISSCKKKSDPIVPAFTVTATKVDLQGGGQGLQFFGKCNNDDVKMTKVIITDPLGSFNQTFNLNGNYFVKNEIFALQGATEAYIIQIGTWSFNFVGNRTADGSSFAITATLAVSK